MIQVGDEITFTLDDARGQTWTRVVEKITNGSTYWVKIRGEFYLITDRQIR